METALVDILHNKDFYSSNVKLWGKNLPPHHAAIWEFCKSGKKQQLNLHNKQADYDLHSSQNIDVEIRQWIGLFDPNKVEWVVVYGVGLGYYYLGLKNWLMGSPKRQVIFIEDDPSVLHAFFETDAAEKLLNDPQAHLIYLDENRLRVPEFEELIMKSLFRELHIGALASYQLKKQKAFDNVSFLISFFRGIHESSTSEYLTLGKTFFKNFYHNILELDQSLNGSMLIDQFKGMPAIICGAGPSLGKNIEVLKTLKDRALIFAGGTAMNALNAYGMLPHFGCGIDPASFHYSRILANIAFETPFLFRTRMNADAVVLVNGPKVYLPGTTGYPIAEWVDNKLGYEPFQIDEGSNVINTSLSIAKKLGCNPILIVGLDLAYTNGMSYAQGITSHGIHDPREQFVTKGKHDELILASDIYAEPIYTLMKWMVESSWYANFARNFPEIKVLNCTEGGIGFAGVENIPLKQAAEQYLKNPMDCEGRISAALLSEDGAKHPSNEKIKEVLRKIVEDLSSLASLMTEFQEAHPDIWIEKLPEASSELKSFEEALSQCPGYDYLLKSFDKAYQNFMGTPEVSRSNVQDLVKGRFPYLADIVVHNLKYVQKAIKRKKIEEEAKLKVHKDVEVPKLVESTFEGSQASIFYYPSGKVLSLVMYKEGVKHGVAKTYSSTGQLLSHRMFENGLEEGVQLYFYPDGKLKSQIPYSQGLLNGEVILYYSNGVIKRSSHYRMGKREGIDELNFINGEPLLRAEYVDDKPFGKATTWHIEGGIAMEISYFTPGVIALINRWDVKGNMIPVDEERRDYIDTAVINSLQLQESITGMAGGLSHLMHSVGGDFSVEIKDELHDEMESLTDQMKNLEDLSKKLLESSGIGGEGKEAIWKTSSNEEQLHTFLQGITAPMQEAMLKLQWQLRSMISDVKKQEKKPDE